MGGSSSPDGDGPEETPSTRWFRAAWVPPPEAPGPAPRVAMTVDVADGTVDVLVVAATAAAAAAAQGGGVAPLSSTPSAPRRAPAGLGSSLAAWRWRGAATTGWKGDAQWRREGEDAAASLARLARHVESCSHTQTKAAATPHVEEEEEQQQQPHATTPSSPSFFSAVVEHADGAVRVALRQRPAGKKRHHRLWDATLRRVADDDDVVVVETASSSSEEQQEASSWSDGLFGAVGAACFDAAAAQSRRLEAALASSRAKVRELEVEARETRASLECLEAFHAELQRSHYERLADLLSERRTTAAALDRECQELRRRLEAAERAARDDATDRDDSDGSDDDDSPLLGAGSTIVDAKNAVVVQADAVVARPKKRKDAASLRGDAASGVDDDPRPTRIQKLAQQQEAAHQQQQQQREAAALALQQQRATPSSSGLDAVALASSSQVVVVHGEASLGAAPSESLPADGARPPHKTGGPVALDDDDWD